MGALWRTIFYQPLFNLLVAAYGFTHDLGLAIIVLTALVKLVLHPLTKRSLKSQRALQDLQPKVEELKRTYKDQKERLGQELMQLYQREKVSPLSSCLPLLLQLPFLWALFQVFRAGLTQESLGLLYPFVAIPATLSHTAFGFLDLASPSWYLGVLAAAAQYWQTKMLVHTKPAVASPGSQDESLAATMNKQALYVMPVLTVVFGFSLPGGLMLYWLTNTLITVFQQYMVFRHHNAAKPVVP